MVILRNQVYVLAVVVNLVYPDDVRMVDVLEQLELKEQLALVLLVYFIFRNHSGLKKRTFHRSDESCLFVLNLEDLPISTFTDS